MTPDTIKRCGKQIPHCSRECKRLIGKQPQEGVQGKAEAMALDQASMAKMTKKDARRYRKRNQNWSQKVANVFQQRIGTLFMMTHCLEAMPSEVVYIIDYSAGPNPTAETIMIKEFLWIHDVFMKSGADDEGREHTEYVVKRNAKARSQTVFGVDPDGGVLVKTIRMPIQFMTMLMSMGEMLTSAWHETDVEERSRLWDQMKRYGDTEIDALVSQLF